jgi:hypothetical protein
MDGTIPRADSRDMVVAHIIYRRETRALAALIAGVEEGDRDRAAVVADHVGFVAGLVHGHHGAEDRLVWPKLHERAPAALAPIVDVMETQHHGLDLALRALEAGAARWRETADVKERDALVEAAAAVHERLTEHLDLEEKEVLRLIDEHLTGPEWAEVAAATGEHIPKDKFAVVFGMGLYDANAQMEGLLKAPIPAATWDAFVGPARHAYADYAQRIFGTSTPNRFIG